MKFLNLVELLLAISRICAIEIIIRATYYILGWIPKASSAFVTSWGKAHQWLSVVHAEMSYMTISNESRSKA